jgi:hypothetical protein
VDKKLENTIELRVLKSADRDPKVEFVADQLERVRWISGCRFIPGEGYLLDWSPVGNYRMVLLSVALKENSFSDAGPGHLNASDTATHAAISDFWQACISQLAIHQDQHALPAFVEIVRNWEPR